MDVKEQPLIRGACPHACRAMGMALPNKEHCMAVKTTLHAEAPSLSFWTLAFLACMSISVAGGTKGEA